MPPFKRIKAKCHDDTSFEELALRLWRGRRHDYSRVSSRILPRSPNSTTAQHTHTRASPEGGGIGSIDFVDRDI
jgi:hypothetical protein